MTFISFDQLFELKSHLFFGLFALDILHFENSDNHLDRSSLISKLDGIWQEVLKDLDVPRLVTKDAW